MPGAANHPTNGLAQSLAGHRRWVRFFIRRESVCGRERVVIPKHNANRPQQIYDETRAHCAGVCDCLVVPSMFAGFTAQLDVLA